MHFAACLSRSPFLPPLSLALSIAAFTRRVRFWTGLSFFLSPLRSHAAAVVCSPDTPLGPPLTTYVSFRDGLAVHGEGRVPLVLAAIFMSDNAIPDKAREPAAKVSAGLKSGCGSYVTHVRPAIANSSVAGTKFRVINGGGGCWNIRSSSCSLDAISSGQRFLLDFLKRERRLTRHFLTFTN